MREALTALLESYERAQYPSWEKGAPDWHKTVPLARAALATPPQAPAVPAVLSDAPIEFKTFSVYADTEFRDANGKLMAVVSSGKHHKRMTTALRAALAASAPGAELGKDQQ